MNLFSKFKDPTLFSRESQENLLKLVNAQNELIECLKEEKVAKEELLSEYRKLTDLNEQIIVELKEQLKELREQLRQRDLALELLHNSPGLIQSSKGFDPKVTLQGESDLPSEPQTDSGE